jgi:hypothetical protein
MPWLGWVIASCVLLWLLDRLLLAAEARGWVFYRRRRASRSALGNAFLEVQRLLEPAQEHALEVRRAEPGESAESGDPPSDGRGRAGRAGAP